MKGLLQTQVLCVISIMLLANTAYAKTCQVENLNTEAGVLKVRPLVGTGAKPQEYIQWAILELALEKSQIPYELEVSSHAAGSKRWVQQLEDLGIKGNVRFLSISPEREKAAFPIRIPLFRGLLSYSYIWVRKDNIDKFADIKKIDDLQNLTVLSGAHWPNTQLFRDSGLNVLTAKFVNFPNMLAHGRADTFIYPAMESANFLALGNEELELVPLTHVMVRYPLDHYFYVDECSKDLQDALYKGLRAAFADGSHDRLLRTHPVTSEAYENIRNGDFTFIDIDGQQMTEETRMAMEEYSIDIE